MKQTSNAYQWWTRKKSAPQNLPSDSYPASLVFSPLISAFCDYSDHGARLHHLDSDQDSTYLREDRRQMLWGRQRTFSHRPLPIHKCETGVSIRLQLRTRGSSLHILPKLTTPHFQKQTYGLRETVKSIEVSLYEDWVFMKFLPLSSQVYNHCSDPALTGSAHSVSRWLDLYPPQSHIQTEHTPKSESISSQSRGNLVTQNTQAISQSHSEP